jgi:hypothetical protein
MGCLAHLLNLCLLIVMLAIVGWLVSPYIFVDVEIPHTSYLHVKYSPDMKPVGPAPEFMVTDSGQYDFGRYYYPIEHPNLHDLNIAQTIFQKKEWQFHAVSNGKVLIGLAIANMGYIETGFIYICDMTTNFHDKISVVFPGGVGAGSVAPSSVATFSLDESPSPACSTFTSSAYKASICFNKTINGWRVSATGLMEKGTRLLLNVKMLRSGDHEFAMVYPLGPRRQVPLPLPLLPSLPSHSHEPPRINHNLIRFTFSNSTFILVYLYVITPPPF